nr:retrovirus-related Pol polyprotein from transposon TNT 1-94 [Tanacetum cinerariifolium]
EQADCSTGYEYGSRQKNADDWRVQNDGIHNQIGNGNLVAVRAEGNAAGYNGNPIRCYNCRGVGHFARDCTVRPRRKDDAYLQTQLFIAQKEEAGIQFQAEDILSYSNLFLNHNKYHRMIMRLSLRLLVWNKMGK